MELYAKVLNYAIPFFLILIAIEWIVGYRKGLRVNRQLDVISSLSSGMTNSIRDVLGLSVVIISYEWLYEHVAIWHFESTILSVVLAIIGLDFVGYWSHRWEHVINIFWNRHIIHHSSEEFNLSCALRQPISSIFGIFFFLYLPMAVLGVDPTVVAIVAPIHLFAQFWYHTKLINKMGWLESFLVTPSHHRVHHAINPEYIDKNFSQIFIVWDKWFGTFQEEMEEVPPVYGVKKAVHTWNPFLINFMHAWSILKDAWRTRSWWDKLRIWFMPTGWRPDDVNGRYPIDVITDVYSQNKYDTNASPGLKAFSWLQLVMTLILTLYLFNNIASFDFIYLLGYGLFLALSIFAYTSLMDRHWIALAIEFLKVAIAIWLMVQLGGWYQLHEIAPILEKIFIAYLGLSLFGTIYFALFEKKTNCDGRNLKVNFTVAIQFKKCFL